MQFHETPPSPRAGAALCARARGALRARRLVRGARLPRRRPARCWRSLAPRTCACATSRGVLARLRTRTSGVGRARRLPLRPSRTTASATARSARGCWRCVWRRRPPRRSTPRRCDSGATRFIARALLGGTAEAPPRTPPLRRPGTKTTKSRMSSSARRPPRSTPSRRTNRCGRRARRRGKTPRAAVSRRTATVSSPAAAISRRTCAAAPSPRRRCGARAARRRRSSCSARCAATSSRGSARPRTACSPRRRSRRARRRPGPAASAPSRRKSGGGCFWRRTRFSSAPPRRRPSPRRSPRAPAGEAPAGTCEKKRREFVHSRLHSRASRRTRATEGVFR